ncbi:GroES-like protein [Cucurbitaria berberidis CBS 394.84]|uniref:GroES-like protein n=1 Tax=Cucurbitaria berberidis CBS 394.84 TaxID=1168544 RepID=A0A9P4GLV2_9PLEO|nr:GroES-like protein [Cucurbitaria berberidis CBS 394.84]KAF1847829.1 GroES-like protein [Cucurbitaria berberidis CBS 394.84]
MSSRKLRTRSITTSPSSASPRAKRRKTQLQIEFQRSTERTPLPENQSALLLHAIRQPYGISTEHEVPEIQHDHELLVKVNAAGLNPIDWKAPDYNFGIPSLPYVSGRELVGTVVKATKTPNSRIREGDIVVVPSTDYRDLRKAAFQEYSIASSFNAIRLPRHISINSGSILGVAFISAALALGICMGVNFESIEDGPDLLDIVRNIDPESLPADIREECLSGIGKAERAKSGDFLVIWGGSSTCAHVTKQIARLAGLKIISVVDGAKHGLRVSSSTTIRPDLLIDSHNPERAISIIKAATGERARFGFDTEGKETAGHLLKSLATSSPTVSALPEGKKPFQRKDSKLITPPATPLGTSSELQNSHLVGLTGLPKTDIPEGVALHTVPIKLYHEVAEVGEALSAWCEKLLGKGLLVPPDVVGTVAGLEGINKGLDRMRKREISGGRLVAVLR